MINKTRIKVRGYHLDVFQHVNNARYLEFMEEGRWAFFDEFDMGGENISPDQAWAVVNININYRREANMGDELEVQTMFSKVGNSSVCMYQKIILANTGDLVADADVTYVSFSKSQRKAIQLPEDYKRRAQQGLVAMD